MVRGKQRKPEKGEAIPWARVHALRLLRHHLDRPARKEDLARVTGDVAGIQAQVLSAARLGLRARVRDLTAGDVDRALWEDRSLVRSWCVRGTAHLLPATDLGMFVAGCARRANRSETWFTRAGLPMAEISKIVEAAARVLDRPLTQEEIADRVGRDLGVPTKTARVHRGWGGRGEATVFEVGGRRVTVGGILHLATLRGLVCGGPPRRNEGTYVSAASWVPGSMDSVSEDPEADLVRRFLRAYGPATLADFAIWTYMTMRDAREVWSRVAGDLRPVEVGGRTLWALREDLAPLRKAELPGPVVRLLPSFDPYLLGHKDKSHLVEGAHYKRVYRPAAWLSPVVLVDGRVAGVWTHKAGAKSVRVTVEPFRPLSREVRALVTEEAEDVARFLGGDLDLKIAGP